MRHAYTCCNVRVLIDSGLGLVTPLGTGVKRSWTALIEGKSGIVSLKDYNSHAAFANLPSTVGAVVQRGPSTEGLWDLDSVLTKAQARTMAPFTQYAIGATMQAIKDSSWNPSTDLQRERTGVCLGTGIGSLDDMCDTSTTFSTLGYRKVAPLFVPRLLSNMAAGHISMMYGFQGPNHAVSTACTTGNHSIGDASRFIQFGDADVMIAGGSEACIHPLAVAGFARAKALATAFNDHPSKASRPFDKDRCGFVIGEGSGVVVLEELEHAKSRGAKIYAELTGYGLSADAHHMTAPHSDGSGAARSMRYALKHAGLAPKSIDYVNAHATSTPLGDVAENRAIKSVLLGTGGRESAAQINVSSTKGSIGHLLGAAGAVESIFTILALYHGILPPTRNLQQVDGPEFDCNYIPEVAQEHQIQHALSNSFGLVLANPDNAMH